jgi:site-specific DNA-methyltransferase (adenine-specific)
VTPVVIGNATLYLGDCLEILPTLPKVDAVITDPPYGVNLGADKSHVIGNRPYESFEDTPANIGAIVVPAIRLAATLAKRCVVTPGTRCAWMYDAPHEIGAIYFPAGAGFSRWGFTCSQPILYYGADPYMPMNKKPNSVQCTEIAERTEHPCPKPIGLMRWLVARATVPSELVLDPFMGSGSTGVAAMELGRSFIGIEIEPKYFDIACRRIEQAQAQGKLFEPEQVKAEQLEL